MFAKQRIGFDRKADFTCSCAENYDRIYFFQLMNRILNLVIKESDIGLSVRYGWTNLSQGSLFWHPKVEPSDVK